MKGKYVKATSIKISLDTRRAKADGTYPLILRLSHNRKTTSIKTGFHFKKEDWDSEKNEVKKSYKGSSNITRLNNEIQKKKAEFLDSLLKLDEKEKQRPLSLTDLKQKIDPSFASSSFYGFGEKIIKDLINAERIGSAKSYRGVLNFLKTFNKGKPLDKNKGGDPKKAKFKQENFSDLKFEEIDYSFLRKLESYHLGIGNELNGLSVYMRGIRSLYNQAIKAGKAEISLYPFTDYKIKNTPTRKRALESSYLSKIIALKLPKKHQAYNARNYFVASYMMYGMNFADMAYLQKNDITHGRIQYRRRKTSKLYDIKISEGLAGIITHYTQQSPKSKYVFPILKRDGAIMQQRDIQWARKNYNENLKTIAEMCGIEQNLTSYVSRHTFATNAMLSEVPVNVISAMLGHSSLKTTEIYLKSLPSNVLDDYNSKLVSNLTL